MSDDEIAYEINSHDPLELRGGHFKRRLLLDHASRVDDGIEPAIFSRCSVHSFADTLFIGHVEPNGIVLAAQLILHRRNFFGIARSGHDRRPRLGKSHRNRAANAAGATRHQTHLPSDFQFRMTHISSLRYSVFAGTNNPRSFASFGSSTRG